MNPLTYEEHEEFGRELQKTKARLIQLASVVGGIYGPHSRSTFSFQKLIDAIERVCLDMEAQAEVDCPGLKAGRFYQ